MIFIVGGHAQGMKEYAEERFGNDRVILDDINSLIRETLESGEDPGQKMQEILADKAIIKEIYVPGKIINIVAK